MWSQGLVRFRASRSTRKEIDRLPLKGASYDDETRSIKQRMANGDTVASLEYSMVIHESLMDGLKDLAQERGLPFVDIIKELDQHRHLLLSWVHLHPEANQIVAKALAIAGGFGHPNQPFIIQL